MDPFIKYFSSTILVLFFISCTKQKSDQERLIIHDEQVFNISKNDDDSFYLPKSTTNEIVSHKFYILSYSEKHEQAEWVAYELKKSQLSYHNYKRPYFDDDPNVETGSASWRNFKNSGYDKGHLCPAGDRRFSVEAFNETFYTSNVAPQLRDFNSGIWNRLEQKTRYWASKYDGVYVVTGGVLSNDLGSIGKESVSVPKYFYKILLDNSRGEYKTIAFLIPHEDSEKPLNKFVVSIDKIEKLTNIDFFPRLPDEIENKLEQSSDYKGWSF